MNKTNNTNDTFLPSGYSVPAGGGNYFTLQDGENNFRILSSAIVGWEYWTKENKPVRSKTKWDKKPADIKIDKDGKSKINHFWSFIVWDYADKGAIKVLTVIQKTIQKPIKALIDNEKWGDPKGFDITISKSGEGFDTEYAIIPNPHSKITKKIETALAEKPANLDALYSGGDPFAQDVEEITEDDGSVPEEEIDI